MIALHIVLTLFVVVAGVATVCGHQRLRLLTVAGHVVMVAAMLDVAFGAPVIPAAIWSLALISAAMVSSAVTRLVVADTTAEARAVRAQNFHSSLELIAMAALVVMQSPHSPSTGAVTHHAQETVIALDVGLAALVTGLVLASSVMAVRSSWSSRVTLASMSMSLAGMVVFSW